jgi:hypothetical protein
MTLPDYIEQCHLPYFWLSQSTVAGAECQTVRAACLLLQPGNMAAVGAGTYNPLGLLQTAFSLPADSDEQTKALQNVRDVLEAAPQPVPMLCTTFIPRIAHQQDGLIRQWFFELLWFGIAQANLPPETRAKRECLCSF